MAFITRICGDEDSDDEIDLTGEFENLTSQSISRQPSIISGESGDLEFGSGSGSARDLEFKKQMAQAKKSSRYEDGSDDDDDNGKSGESDDFNPDGTRLAMCNPLLDTFGSGSDSDSSSEDDNDGKSDGKSDKSDGSDSGSGSDDDDDYVPDSIIKGLQDYKDWSDSRVTIPDKPNSLKKYVNIIRRNILGEAKVMIKNAKNTIKEHKHTLCIKADRDGNKYYLKSVGLNDESLNRHLVLLDLGDEGVPAIIEVKKVKKRYTVLLQGLDDLLEKTLSGEQEVKFSSIEYFGTTVDEYDAASEDNLRGKELLPALLDLSSSPLGDKPEIFKEDAEGAIESINAGGGVWPANERQREALRLGLCRVKCVHGPPGTGKSSIIPNLCIMVLPGKITIVVCETNKAVGVDVLKLKSLEPEPKKSLKWPQPSQEEEKEDTASPKTVITVIGNRDRVVKEAKPYHIEERLRRMIEAEPGYKELKKWEKDFFEFIGNEKENTKLPDKPGKQITNVIKIKKFKSLRRLASNPSDFEVLNCIDVTDTKMEALKTLHLAMKYNKLMGVVLGKFGKEFKTKLPKDKNHRYEVLQALACIIKDFEKAKEDYISAQKEKCREYILKKTTVFVSTVASLARREFNKVEADLMIVDEAGTVREESMPLLLKPNPSYLVLIGDPLQLPPFSRMSSEVSPVSYMERCYRYDAREEEVATAACSYTMLIEQYRMPRELGEIVSKLFYGGKLITPESILLGENNVIWVKSYAHEGKSGTSFENKREVAHVKKAVESVKKKNPKKTTIKVITFYKAQLEALEKALKGFPDVEVCTVDSAQGSEADIVIISCVRSGGKHIGFLSTKCRLNVAISRAKKQLIIIGNLKTFCAQKIWCRLIDEIPNKLKASCIESKCSVPKSFP
ncbi:hypothetical protein TrST_g10670 [Triparma strigata]|uniref:Uncharacterized protein n=1 Tax=Triparma strigata TaxID=1606541 RepID=A0A9W7C1N2_9STRA|nr:hypothetical protein TrST_g10670 [Triparma strigata]